ncbi:ABC transporter permease subunit [uncultured Sneathiella sp.]|uniref:ABC transporter permease n=1 Tax=uncultured Sneathiella sp. TaxID=879315 RepID=UPI002599F0EC|nr:ABC transporter permease subunit [uncultured Sneathiella sp.]
MLERWKIPLLLSPALLLIAGLFLGGLFLGLIGSLGYMPLLGREELNLDAYRNILFSTGFYQSFLLTFYISLMSTIIASALAIGAALILRRHFIGRSVINFLFQLNLTVPHLVGAVGILYLFSQSGFFARLAFEFRLISGPSDFPAMIYDPLAIGIILQYVWKEVPFIGMILLANMQTFGHDYEAVSRTLGANRWQSFRFVLLPLVSPGLLAAALIVFAFTFGAYEIPALLGQSYPAALPVLAYQSFTDVDLNARPEALAMAMIIALLSAVMIFGYARLARRYMRS